MPPTSPSRASTLTALTAFLVASWRLVAGGFLVAGGALTAFLVAAELRDLRAALVAGRAPCCYTHSRYQQIGFTKGENRI
jgi:hypothetical protein